VKSSKIPDGWEYWCNGGRDWDQAWQHAFDLKSDRERLRPDLLCRVKVIGAAGEFWILRREETRARKAKT
jgi:hypothetical protein